MTTLHIGWSSHLYPLEAADFDKVPDYDGEPLPETVLPDDDVVLFIRPDGPDALLRGRGKLAAALATGDPRATVDVRIVFKPSIAKWNLPATLIRVLRNHDRYRGTGVYHISVAAVRELGLERAIRSVEHPQKRGKEDRAAAMRKLLDSLRTNGYNDKKPIHVMLCRTFGRVDSLRQGHHRVSACMECGIDRMAVAFSAAGALPAVLDSRRRKGC